MSYNGYTNEATYFADLLVSNERKVYFAARAIAMEHRNPKVSGPLIHRLVTPHDLRSERLSHRPRAKLVAPRYR